MRAAIIPFAVAALASLAAGRPVTAADPEARPLGHPTAPPTAMAHEEEPGAGGEARPSAIEQIGTWRVAGSLAGVLGLIGVCAVLARSAGGKRGGLLGRMGPGGPAPSGILEVLGRYPIARGQSLVLLRVDGRVLLLGQTQGKGGGSLATLSEMQSPEEVASIVRQAKDAAGESISARFRSMLGDAEKQAARELDREPVRHGHTPMPPRPASSRAAYVGPGGDRIELLRPDAAAARPGAEPAARPAPERAPRHAVPMPARTVAVDANDAFVAELRRRLDSLRGEAAA